MNSGLSSQAFARINTESEEGFLIDFSTGKAQIEKWKFEHNFIGENETVFFSSPAGSGKTLSAIFSQKDKREISRGAGAAIAALSALISEKSFENTGDSLEEAFTSVGAGGIYISDDFKQVMIAPCHFFARCATRQKANLSAPIQGIWENKALTANNALAFTRGAIAYRALAGNTPFTEEDLTKRQADILDRNFLPMELARPDLGEEITSAINESLALVPSLRIAPGEKRFVTEKQKEDEAHNKVVVETFPLESILQELKNDETNEKMLTAEQMETVTRWLKSKKRSVTLHRFVRRNQKQLTVAIIGVIVAISVAGNFHRENGKLATSLGLTPAQTAQTLFTGIHKSDVTIIREVFKGSNRNDLLEIVSGYYVTYKQRLAFNQDDATVSPASWLFLQNQTNFWMYGITNFKVEGEKVEFPYSYPRRRDKMDKLSPENGGGTKKGQETEVTVSYNLVHTDSSNRVTISKETDTVSLRWNGKRWIIRKIQGQNTNSSVTLKQLHEAYGKALENNQNDIIAAAAELRETYPWIPEESELADGARQMEKDYHIKAATDYLDLLGR